MCIFVENIQNLKVYLEMEDNNQSIIFLFLQNQSVKFFTLNILALFFSASNIYIYIYIYIFVVERILKSQSIKNLSLSCNKNLQQFYASSKINLEFKLPAIAFPSYKKK